MTMTNTTVPFETSKNWEAEYPDELQSGVKLLGGQYTIESFLNSGGFGITYLAKDSLDRIVVIKECFPDSICHRSNCIVRARSRAHKTSFASIVEMFIQEARSQAKLVHPNIVGVHQVFNDNETAYMAIDYIDGGDLLDKIEGDDELSPNDVQHWLRQTLDAVGFVHADGMLHRDLSPDNILINEDNEPVLIDFGAAREQASKADRVLSTMRVVKDGYSPQEFYVAGSAQSPASDLYALGATFYHVVTGEAPVDSQSRLAAIASTQNDTYVPLAGRVKGYPEAFLASIDKALKVLPKDRHQSAQDWLDNMDEEAPQKKVALPTAAKSTEKKGKAPLLVVVAGAALVAAGILVMNFDLGGAITKDATIKNAESATATLAISEPSAKVVASTTPSAANKFPQDETVKN